jgi:hypothetical protein
MILNLKASVSGVKVWSPPAQTHLNCQQEGACRNLSIDNNYRDLYCSGCIDEDGGVTFPLDPEEESPELVGSALNDVMHALKRTKGKLCKNGCGKWIYLQEDAKGKWRPHNQDDNEFHRCSKKPSNYKCHNCGNNIVFDGNKVSDSGTPIPLNESDHLPHQCPNYPFYIRR